MNVLGGLLFLLGLVAFVVLWMGLIGAGWLIGTVWGWFDSDKET